MTPDEMIAVIQAYKDGKAIEWRYKIDGCTWRDSLAPTWNFDAFDYRIKPEPIYLWVNLYGTNNYTVYEKKEHALLGALPHCPRKAVLFREVIGAHDENGDK